MRIKVHHFGKSFLGQSLQAFSYGTGPKNFFLTSGIHGNEVEGIVLGSLLWAQLTRKPIPKGWTLYWIPIYNPDGFFHFQRWAYTGVDLNRNFPTAEWSPIPTDPKYPPGEKPASEPETQAFIRFSKKVQPAMLVELHSYKKTAVLIDNPELNKTFSKLGARWAKNLKVPALEGGLGYETRGCMFQWMNERRIPTQVLEVKRDISPSQIEKRYLKPSLNFIRSVMKQL